MTPKNFIFYFFHIFYFNSYKGSYQIASILDRYIIIKERVDVNQDWPSLIIKPPPPPEPQDKNNDFY